jgi:hypothetical protein
MATKQMIRKLFASRSNTFLFLEVEEEQEEEEPVLETVRTCLEMISGNLRLRMLLCIS